MDTIILIEHLDGHQLSEIVMPALSNTQAQVIYEIHRELGYEVGERFTPYDIFPGDKLNRTARRLRRCVRRLWLMGYLKQVYPSQDIYTLTPEALSAYDTWAQIGKIA